MGKPYFDKKGVHIWCSLILLKKGLIGGAYVVYVAYVHHIILSPSPVETFLNRKLQVTITEKGVFESLSGLKTPVIITFSFSFLISGPTIG